MSSSPISLPTESQALVAKSFLGGFVTQALSLCSGSDKVPSAVKLVEDMGQRLATMLHAEVSNQAAKAILSDSQARDMAQGFFPASLIGDNGLIDPAFEEDLKSKMMNSPKLQTLFCEFVKLTSQLEKSRSNVPLDSEIMKLQSNDFDSYLPKLKLDKDSSLSYAAGQLDHALGNGADPKIMYVTVLNNWIKLQKHNFAT